jgi:hypothetical protein
VRNRTIPDRPPSEPNKWKKRWRRILAVALIVALLVGLGFAIYKAQMPGTAHAASRCEGRAMGLEGVPGVSQGLRADAPRTFEAVGGATSIDYDFGGSREIDEDRFLSYKLPGARPADIVVSLTLPLQEAPVTGKGIFPTKEKQLAYIVRTEPDAATEGVIEIPLCLDPAGPRMAKPGSYHGTLLIQARNVTPLAVPINADIRESRDLLVWLIALGCLLLGLAAKAVEELRVAKKPVTWNAFREHVTWNFILQLLGGAIAMVITVYTLYYSSSSFGGNQSDWLRLGFGIFALALTGITAASLLGLGKTTPLARRKS